MSTATTERTRRGQLRSEWMAAAALAAMFCLPLAAQTTSPETGASGAAATAPASGSTAAQAQGQATAPDAAPEAPDTAADASASATGHAPLQAPIKQGFWGRLNPFARKSYVKGQLSPIQNRVDELNGLSAKNAKSASEVERHNEAELAAINGRTQQASDTATAAQQQTQQTAEQAAQLRDRADSANTQVQSSDQYEVAQTAELHFRPGLARLNPSTEQKLSSFLQGLSGQKGYLVEITAYSNRRGLAGIDASQDLANTVVRYMVLNQNIPLYRIFTSGVGNAPQEAAMGAASTRRTGGGTVQIRILKNGAANASL